MIKLIRNMIYAEIRMKKLERELKIKLLHLKDMEAAYITQVEINKQNYVDINRLNNTLDCLDSAIQCYCGTGAFKVWDIAEKISLKKARPYLERCLKLKGEGLY